MSIMKLCKNKAIVIVLLRKMVRLTIPNLGGEIMIHLGKNYKRYFMLVFMLVLALNYSACNLTDSKKDKDKEITYDKKLSFDEFFNQMLKEDLNSDLTTYVQFVENPENFGITKASDELQGIGINTFNQQTELCKSRLEQLKSYDYESLTDAQKLDYDTVKTYLEQRISIQDLAYYQDNLSTNQGDHIIIPGILGLHADRFFDTLGARGIQDISKVEEYFDIYSALGDYLKEIAQFEREKAEQGLFMEEERANQVARVCRDHVDSECLEIQKTFEAELEELDWVSDADREKLLEENKKLVKKHMVAGYQAIADAMKDCAQKGGKVNYLGETEAGKRYYEYVVNSTINDAASVEEMAALLDTYTKEWIAEKAKIEEENPTIMTTINTKLQDYSDPELLVATLTEKSKEYFPDVTMEWGIDKMPECMNAFAMGLFYPQALDSSIPKQTVYVGTLLTPGAYNYVETIGHEGVPGHLYNYAYFLNLDISQYRKFIGWASSVGTLEGWTTYIEEYCYRFVGLSDQEARYLELTRLIELGVIQTIDFGVNYYGWTTADISKYLKEYQPAYLLMSAYIESLVKDSICSMGPYVMGYIYLTQIKEQMQDQMGSSFADMAFHTAYLNVGPTTFDLLRKQLLED